MNKAELIEAISEKVGDRRTAAAAVEAVIEAVTGAVARGEKVALAGFGVFEKIDRRARVGRNPATGATVKVAATSVPKFRPGQGFKDVVSGAKKATATVAKTVGRAGAVNMAAPAKKAAKKAAPAKKAAAKKAPAKKAAAKKAPPKAAPAAPKLADTNGDLASAAKEAAAQAKSTVASAPNPVAGPAPVPLIGPEPSRLPVVAAIVAGVLAIVVVLLARRHSED